VVESVCNAGRGFRDAIAAAMAIDVLERFVARIAKAAMDLHRAVSRLITTMVEKRISSPASPAAESPPR
jgi:hypothetical protein